MSSVTDRKHQDYNQRRINHWDLSLTTPPKLFCFGNYYRNRLQEVFKYNTPPQSRVLELGCGFGNLLASLEPAYGVGVDFSEKAIKLARHDHPDLTFIQADAGNLNLEETFDIIVLSDLINDVWDVKEVFDTAKRHSKAGTRILINFYSHLWEFPLKSAQRLGFARSTLDQNWLTLPDVLNLLNHAGLELIRSTQEVLLPISIPFLSKVFNRYFVKLWPFSALALTNFVVARPITTRAIAQEPPTVSVIVPARNESGNIEEIIERMPNMGKNTEIIFVEGHSSDDTYEAIERAINNHPDRQCSLYRQTGKGKGDAVRLGYDVASGGILMILDADLSVAPEALEQFYEAVSTNRCEFANGVRLVYPMDREAMRFLNLLGNKFFSAVFSWLLGQPLKDTLCGTKVLWREDYQKIKANRSYFGDFDPFGDFDLIFGAARLNLRISDIPLRYRERTYGSTNIRRWKHGMLLIKMVLFAMRRIKFI
ncbi:glycosyltransferase [Pseudomonadota bacterium]